MNEQPVVQQKKSALPKILIGCGVLFLVALPLCGILSAITIPAFLRSVNKSKESEAQGMIVRMTQNARASWMSEACAFPESLPPTGTIAQASGGQKYLPTIPESLRSDMGVSPGDQLYFVYSTQIKSEGAQTLYTVTAQADFDGDGQVFHTMTSTVTGEKDESGGCDATISPLATTNLFQ